VNNFRGELTADLLAVLRRATGVESLDFATPPTPLTGGFWAQLISFRLADAPEGLRHRLVARVMPDESTARKETAIQRAVSDGGYPTPRVHLAGGSEVGIAGQAYLVMDLAAGQPLLAGLDGLEALLRLPRLARQLPVTLARVLADLHRMEPAPVAAALAHAGVPEPTLGSMTAHLRSSASALGRADLVEVLDWLAAHPPAEARIVVCHGDMHPFNVLADASGDVTVLDWSAAVLAPATYDLGFTSLLLSEPPLVVPGPLRAVVHRAGRSLAQRFLRSYEQAAGSEVDRTELAWHQGLVCVRALLEVATWSADGTLAERSGHPWLLSGEAFAVRLHGLTGVRVAAR
jgi:aminoglycoside phosphotransferase (APT) family kinase protein